MKKGFPEESLDIVSPAQSPWITEAPGSEAQPQNQLKGFSICLLDRVSKPSHYARGK
jgi:hypothetical protein